MGQLNPLAMRKLRKKWLHAQQVHAEEHETGQPRSLSCEAVGHLESIGGYITFFDHDEQRKFLREYRDVKYA